MIKKTNHNRFFIENMVKEMILEQSYSAEDEFLNNPMLADPGNPDSQDGMTPQQIDDVVWKKPPPELVSDDNFWTELRKYCGDKYVEGEFNIDAGEYYQKNPGEKCQWYSYLWNAGFPNQSKWPGAIHLNQHLEEARDMYKNPKKYISKVTGRYFTDWAPPQTVSEKDIKDWAVENWIYRREQFFKREYKRKQAEIGSTSGKPAFSELGKSIGNAFLYLYQLFTEDAQEIVRDADRTMEADLYQNNIQLAVVNINKRNTEGVGGTHLDRVRSHSVFFSRHSYNIDDDFSEKMQQRHGKSIGKFIPPAWHPSFYRIHEDILKFIVDFIREHDPKLRQLLMRSVRRDDSGQQVINLSKVKNDFKVIHNMFRMSMKVELMKIFMPGKVADVSTGSSPMFGSEGFLGFGIFKSDSYIDQLFENMARVFHLGPGGWNAGEGMPTDMDVPLQEQRGLHGVSGGSFGGPTLPVGTPPGSTRISQASAMSAADKREAERKIREKKLNPYGKEEYGQWSPLVLFLLTLKGFDFFEGQIMVQTGRRRNRKSARYRQGLTAREWHRSAQKGLIFSTSGKDPRAKRRTAMLKFIKQWTQWKPSEFFNKYYLNKKYIPSLFDKNKPDSNEHLIQWVAFQRATIYDPTSEIAQNSSRNFGAYGNQKIQDKDGKTKEIPKGYAYFVEWTKDTFDLFEKEQLVKKIAEHNTNVAMALLYSTIEWSLTFRVAAAGFGQLEHALYRGSQTIIGPMQRTLGMRAAAGLRWVASFGRVSFIVGILAGVYYMFDPFGQFDINKDFAEKYSKIKDVVCKLRDLANADLDNTHADSFKQSVVKYYEEIIIAYNDLVKYYTTAIQTFAKQGISKRDLDFNKRFKVVERLQYFQKYEMNVGSLFKKSHKEMKEMTPEEIIEIFKEVERLGFDLGENCKVMEKQIVQLRTRQNQKDYFELQETGTPTELTGFPAFQDLMGHRAKNKDELQSMLDSFKAGTDTERKSLPLDPRNPMGTTYVDIARQANRSPDPIGVWIQSGIDKISETLSLETTKDIDRTPPEDSPESEKQNKKPEKQNEVKLLSESTVKWKAILNRLKKYYGDKFDPVRALQALNLVNGNRLASDVDLKDNTDAIFVEAAGEFDSYSTSSTFPDMSHFKFIANTDDGKQLLSILKFQYKLRPQILGYKTEEFPNGSNFFAGRDKVFYSARYANLNNAEAHIQERSVYTGYSNDHLFGEGLYTSERRFNYDSTLLNSILLAASAEENKTIQNREFINLDRAAALTHGNKTTPPARILQIGWKTSVFNKQATNKENKENAENRISPLDHVFVGKSVINTVVKLNTNTLTEKIKKMEKDFKAINRIIYQGVTPDTVDAQSTADKDLVKAKDMLKFHIQLMKFLKSSVRVIVKNDQKQTKIIRDSMLKEKYRGPIGLINLKRHLQNKMLYFLQLGEISKAFDRYFTDDISLNFLNIKRVEV
mgnify:FL=1|tara:strand:- start:15361 stop:19713 length:4353 start_codon:yes stop_codon:yes gene_type:complete